MEESKGTRFYIKIPDTYLLLLLLSLPPHTFLFLPSTSPLSLPSSSASPHLSLPPPTFLFPRFLLLSCLPSPPQTSSSSSSPTSSSSNFLFLLLLPASSAYFPSPCFFCSSLLLFRFLLLFLLFHISSILYFFSFFLLFLLFLSSLFLSPSVLFQPFSFPLLHPFQEDFYAPIHLWLCDVESPGKLRCLPGNERQYKWLPEARKESTHATSKFSKWECYVAIKNGPENYEMGQMILPEIYFLHLNKESKMQNFMCSITLVTTLHIITSQNLCRGEAQKEIQSCVFNNRDMFWEMHH